TVFFGLPPPPQLEHKEVDKAPSVCLTCLLQEAVCSGAQGAIQRPNGPRNAVSDGPRQAMGRASRHCSARGEQACLGRAQEGDGGGSKGRQERAFGKDRARQGSWRDGAFSVPLAGEKRGEGGGPRWARRRGRTGW